MKKRSLRWKILVKNINDEISLKKQKQIEKAETTEKNRKTFKKQNFSAKSRIFLLKAEEVATLPMTVKDPEQQK